MTSAPVFIGAVATLFDTTPLLAHLSIDEGATILNQLPCFALDFELETLEKIWPFILGQHFFNSKNVPIFDLGALGLLEGMKIGDIIAPPSASKGPYNQGNGPVDWLALSAGPGSIELSEAFRVETAGGKLSTCSGVEGFISVQYAAQYWFY